MGHEGTHDWSPSGVATSDWWPDGSVLRPTYSRVVRVKKDRSLYGDVMRSVSNFFYMHSTLYVVLNTVSFVLFRL